jgi:hypothetical protein
MENFIDRLGKYMMRSNASNVDEYLAEMPEDRRKAIFEWNMFPWI